MQTASTNCPHYGAEELIAHSDLMVRGRLVSARAGRSGRQSPNDVSSLHTVAIEVATTDVLYGEASQVWIESFVGAADSALPATTSSADLDLNEAMLFL